MYLNYKFFKLKNDILLMVLVAISLTLLPAELYLFLTDRSLHICIALTAIMIFPFTAFFLGRPGVWWFFFIYANLSALTIIYRDFTSLFILIVCFLYIPRQTKKRMIIISVLYTVDIFTVATMHNKDPVHVYIHLIMSFAFIFLMYFKFKSITTLDLLPDEIKILDQLSEGKAQKEIIGYSENTVCKKLKAARKRNGLSNNKQLIMFYRKSK